jgi:hypothetical protein
MQRVNLSRYFDEVVYWSSSEETLEMSPRIGPLARNATSTLNDPGLGCNPRLGWTLGSECTLGSGWIIGSDASSARNAPSAQDDPRLG